mmetsp:Transcript_103853/g.298997  ORF Transcript_103853/g.298997 Transcript_103853/m.298997 type:complete len:100 (-) Transcript_103853:1-300(-)
MDAEDTPALYAFNVLINIVFVSEMIVKVVAQGRKPWMYFNEAWNCLDFTIVVLALIPYMVNIENPDMLNMIMIIRFVVREYTATTCFDFLLLLASPAYV